MFDLNEEVLVIDDLLRSDFFTLYVLFYAFFDVLLQFGSHQHLKTFNSRLRLRVLFLYKQSRIFSSSNAPLSFFLFSLLLFSLKLHQYLCKVFSVELLPWFFFLSFLLWCFCCTSFLDSFLGKPLLFITLLFLNLQPFQGLGQAFCALTGWFVISVFFSFPFFFLLALLFFF